MKLNLLPATVSKGAQAKTAWVVSIVIGLLSIGASIAMVMVSSKDLADAKSEEAAARPAAQAAVDMAARADTYMQDPGVIALVRNVSLAQAMITHNDKYPDLYNNIKNWIPPFYRLTSMSAAPATEEQATVTLTGTLQTYQQYADLMLALMRNPNAVSVSRSGFQSVDPYVPNLVEIDQTGRPRKPGENPIPDDPLERLAFFESQGQTSGFTGEGNFGSGTTNTRGAIPGQSLVTVQIVLNSRIQTPNPRQSMSGGPVNQGTPAPGNTVPGAPRPGNAPAPGGTR